MALVGWRLQNIIDINAHVLILVSERLSSLTYIVVWIFYPEIQGTPNRSKEILEELWFLAVFTRAVVQPRGIILWPHSEVEATRLRGADVADVCEFQGFMESGSNATVSSDLDFGGHAGHYSS